MTIHYIHSGDYLIPDLQLPKETRLIGKWGRMHWEFLKEMDKVIDPVCALCRNYEMAEFIHGVQVGIRLAQEVRMRGKYRQCAKGRHSFRVVVFLINLKIPA